MAQSITQEENEILDKLRKEFLVKYETNIEGNEYDIRDLNRLKENNTWLYTFYRHVHKRYDSALTLIPDVLKWRKDNKANDFLNDGELPFPEEIFKKGSMFLRNSDKNGIPLLHFAVRTHKKDQYPFDQVCKFIAYHFEKNYKFDWNSQIILFFDMSDTGLANLDMEMIKFVVNCLKIYYPGLISYMLIFQMPFIFNAAWKIIKNWLPPEATQIIKFVDKKSIKEYIDEKQLFVHMGGSDSFQYNYDPSLYKNTQKELDESIKKRVSFASIDASLLSSNHYNNSFNNNSNKTIVKSQSEIIDYKSKVLIENNEEKLKKQEETSYENKNAILSFNPSNEIIFQVNDSKADISQSISLTNNSSMHIAYKIKITSPDKFRVKPGTGIINPLSSAQIMINFLKDHHNTVSHHRDKFLILWTQVEAKTTVNDLTEVWKNQTKTQINEHKLKCVLIRSGESAKHQINESNDANQDSIIINNAVSLSTNINKISETNQSIVNNPNTNITNILKSELRELKTSLNEITKLQQKSNKKYRILLFLVYFLIVLNILQLLLQSNLYNYVIEPYIDNIFFRRD